MTATRTTMRSPAVRYGTIERDGDRVIYRDEKNVRWRCYDFIGTGPAKVPVEVGSTAATSRIWVREDGKERRRVTFSDRNDTLEPSVNYHLIATAWILVDKKWVIQPWSK